MKSINWTRLMSDHEDDAPPPLDPDFEPTKERPAVTNDLLRREDLRDTAEHKVLKNIARTYARYYGPNKPN